MTPESTRSSFDLGVVAMDRGEFESAIAHFTAAAEVDDRPALALSKRGVCRVRSGDRTRAARDFAEALDRDPRCTSALVNLGNLALEANMLEEARTRYEAALLIDDLSSAAHHNLAIVYRRTGRIADSVRELRRAASLENQPVKIVERFKAMWRRRT
jgi:tetratricopeptide (TPR) repeat protein